MGEVLRKLALSLDRSWSVGIRNSRKGLLCDDDSDHLLRAVISAQSSSHSVVNDEHLLEPSRPIWCVTTQDQAT